MPLSVQQPAGAFRHGADRFGGVGFSGSSRHRLLLRRPVFALPATHTTPRQQCRRYCGASRPQRRLACDAKLSDGSSRGDPSSTERDEETNDVFAVPSVAYLLWGSSIGVFLMTNYFWAASPWPSFLTAVDVRTWALLHALSGMLFAGGVFTTAFVEWLVFKADSKPVDDFWFAAASKSEWAIVLPGLTGSLVSGVAQSWMMYQRPLMYAPLHVKLPIHILVLFGIWWLATDVAQRSAAGDKSMQGRRQVSNAVSCCLILVIYGIMVLKPGGM